jgi:glycosyltransferase involved in cell wall biosynthesis
MERKRVLIISHTYTAPVNRLKFDIMAQDERFEFLLVTPKKWRNLLTIADNDPGLENGKYKTLFVGVRFGWHPVIYLIPRLRKIIGEFKPDLIYCEQEPICLVSLQVAILSGSIPIIYFSWENIDRKDIRYRLFWPARTICLRRSISMAVGSSDVACVIRKHGYRKPIYITPHLGVSEKLFFPKEAATLRRTITQRSFLVGYVGRFVEQKDVSTLIKALSALNHDIEWHLVLVGGGPKKTEYETLIRNLGIIDRVTFQSPVPHDAIPQLLNCFDVLVLPSKTTPTWKEQFGHVLIEAMACGVLVIGSSSGEIPNVIGNAGLVFREEDVEDLNAKLTMLFQNVQLRDALREKGLRRVKELYTDSRIASNMIALYEIALGMERATYSGLEAYYADS